MKGRFRRSKTVDRESGGPRELSIRCMAQLLSSMRVTQTEESMQCDSLVVPLSKLLRLGYQTGTTCVIKRLLTELTRYRASSEVRLMGGRCVQMVLS